MALRASPTSWKQSEGEWLLTKWARSLGLGQRSRTAFGVPDPFWPRVGWMRAEIDTADRRRRIGHLEGRDRRAGLCREEGLGAAARCPGMDGSRFTQCERG